MVSVPFRGISFPNSVLEIRKNEEFTFPSPSGASHFQISYKLNKETEMSFRPLPGHLISKFEQVRDVKKYVKSFPSPSGASHFQIANMKSVYVGKIGFRPLPGHLISKYDIKHTEALQREFPSPSGASHFQINRMAWRSQYGREGFRPLPGHLISK